MDPAHEELHRAMLRPAFYPDGTEGVEFTETHVSRLYLTDRHVYKIKKPVDLGFLDFTTLDRRRFFCQEEIRLNRRLCRGVYEDVVTLRSGSGGPSLEGPGEPVEVAVRMKRLPAHRMLDRLLEQGDEELKAWMPRLAARLADFHARAQVCRPPAEPSQVEVVARNWQENFSQTEAAAGSLLAREAWTLLFSRMEDFLGRHRDLIEERETTGWVREGHGDLHAEHVCLTEPVCIYDCIEFNRRFRVADVLADLAFLLMDLEYHGRRDLASVLQQAYFDRWDALRGERGLLDFYKIYRAFVRGKVDSFLARDPDAPPETRKPAASRSTRHFSLALGYLCRPMLVLTCGLMGAGKSTVAAELGRLTGGRLLRSDVVRKELAGIPVDRPAPAGYGEDLYAPEMTARTYAELLRRSADTLRQGRLVIVDASFSRRIERNRFRKLAREQEVPLLLVRLECAPETARDRMEQRARQRSDPSDGRPELLSRQREAFEEPQAEEPHLRVDTRRELDYNVHAILCRMAKLSGVSR